MRAIHAYMALPVSAALLLAGCSDDDDSPSAPNDTTSTVLVSSQFREDLDGWTGGTHATNFGTVTWLDRGDGMVKLDGVGFDGDPNAWIWKEIDLPKNATTLKISTSAHDRGDGAVSLRIRLVDADMTSHTILDWEEFDTGDEGFEFIPQSFDIAAFAGETVTFYFEIGDIDGGGNNQRYFEYIEIHE
jgi:hypothetical protein